MLQGEGICMESLVDMISLFSVHSMTCHRGGLGKSGLEQGEATHSCLALPGKCIQDSEAFPVERPNFQLNYFPLVLLTQDEPGLYGG